MNVAIRLMLFSGLFAPFMKSYSVGSGWLDEFEGQKRTKKSAQTDVTLCTEGRCAEQRLAMKTDVRIRGRGERREAAYAGWSEGEGHCSKLVPPFRGDPGSSETSGGSTVERPVFHS